MKHRWSAPAACIGVLVAILLILPTDIGPNAITGVIFPPFNIIVGLLELFHANHMPSWSIPIVIPIAIAGNAGWYMLVGETVRLLIERLRSQSI